MKYNQLIPQHKNMASGAGIEPNDETFGVEPLGGKSRRNAMKSSEMADADRAAKAPVNHSDKHLPAQSNPYHGPHDLDEG